MHSVISRISYRLSFVCIDKDFALAGAKMETVLIFAGYGYIIAFDLHGSYTVMGGGRIGSTATPYYIHFCFLSFSITIRL